MKKLIWAAYFHSASTDESPQHGLCPPELPTFCKFHKARLQNKIHKHSKAFPYAILEAIKPVYRALTQDELLNKCLHGKTRNVNESFNNVIWTRCPKMVFVGLNVLKIGVYDAVLLYNDENIGKLKVLEELGFIPGYNSTKQLTEIDDKRIKKAEASITTFALQSRKKKRNRKRKRDATANDPDDPDYGAGIA